MATWQSEAAGGREKRLPAEETPQQTGRQIAASAPDSIKTPAQVLIRLCSQHAHVSVLQSA